MIIKDEDVLKIMREKVEAGTARPELVALFEQEFAKTGKLSLNPALLTSLNLRRITAYEFIQEP